MAEMVVVFGGTGFLGKRVTRHCLDRSFVVRVASRDSRDGYRTQGFEVEHTFVDVNDDRSVGAAVINAFAGLRLCRRTSATLLGRRRFGCAVGGDVLLPAGSRRLSLRPRSHARWRDSSGPLPVRFSRRQLDNRNELDPISGRAEPHHRHFSGAYGGRQGNRRESSRPVMSRPVPTLVSI
jgi:hypothetical protein